MKINNIDLSGGLSHDEYKLLVNLISESGEAKELLMYIIEKLNPVYFEGIVVNINKIYMSSELREYFDIVHSMIDDDYVEHEFKVLNIIK